jgi:uncharacterized protein YyaL (SSP411 family)
MSAPDPASSSASAPRAENRLAHETSPYLLQHKHNPVDWWPWGPDALAHAQAGDKPILLSVGYAACHWCHVMAHESFEDPATAAVMNELFVNIKVDREERPDIDQIYMTALHHLGEQGGWPLTMFLTPKGEPIWGGTYFPPTARYGRAAFGDVLRQVARIFREEPQTVAQNREALMQRLADTAKRIKKVTIGRDELDLVAEQVAGLIDTDLGGVRGAPKFPQVSVYEILWRAGLRTGTAKYFNLVEFTLDRICEGGIYDHLGGGFSRYSTDERWLVPHFEKMLYDNAQLLEMIALAYGRSKRPLFRARAAETVAWLEREMRTGDGETGGAFAASLDADSEGEEGKFYVWSPAEIEHVLGPADAEFFAEHYDVTAGGNFEGHSILNRLQWRERTEAEERDLTTMRAKLLAARERRVRPGLDDKVLADWNGLMIAALVQAGIAFEEKSWIDLAARAFDFILRHMTRGDRLGHSWRQDRLLFPGLASDFAAMIRAALALSEATGKRKYLDQAVTWQNALDRHYANPETGGYFLTADDAEGLVVRPQASTDDAVPNHNAVIAQNLLRLAVLAGDDEWRAKFDRMIDGLAPRAVENLYGHLSLINAIDLRMRAAEIVIVGRDSERFAQAALRLPWLDRIVLRAPSADALPPAHPAQAKIAAAGEGTAAFVCVGETCSLPVTTPDGISAAVQAMRS